MAIVEICDAVTNKLEAAVNLPDHETHKYLNPPVISQAPSPVLCVYVSDATYSLEQTEDNYVDTLTLTIEWWESAAGVVDGNFDGTEDLALAALQRSEDIIDQLRLMAGGVGVDPTEFQTEGTLQSAKFGLAEGMKWLTRVELQVQKWS